MADFDLKSITPASTVTDGTTIVFGAEGQSATPKPYTTAAIKAWIASFFTTKANNLSDLASADTARTNLGMATTGSPQLPFYADSGANAGIGPLCGGNISTFALTNQRFYLVPFIVPEQKTFTKFSINFATSVSGAKIRLGLYNANQTTRQPTTLILDAGEIILDTGTTGVLNRNTLTISQALAPGLYYAAFLSNLTASISGIGTNGSSVLGFSLTSGGSWLAITALLLSGQTYQALSVALSDLSATSPSPTTSGNTPAFTLL